MDLPPPAYSTTLGPSDEFELRILPARELPVSYQVQPDGSVSIPYVGRLEVAGLEPHQIEAKVREQLIEQKIYTDPSVSVVVKTYRSKRVQILGQIKKPDSYPFEPGMSLLRLISLAGGFTELADDDSVTIRRKLKDGQVKIVELSVDDIIANRIPDVPLQAGDSINVPKSAL